jgi:hypothetical protein
MTREAESQLLDFCVRQRERFLFPEWLRFESVNRDMLVTTALFLAGLDWYGHYESLLRVAAQLRPDCVGHFSAMVRLTDFDCSRFASLLKARLRHEHALA